MEKVGLIIFDGVRAFDYAVVDEVWGPHRGLPVPTPLSELRICAPGRRPVRLTGGLRRTPQFGLDALVGCDLVIVPGMEDPGTVTPPAVLNAVRTAYRGGTPVASLCAGAFVLAEAGLLDGRTATTHWAFADQLAQRYPAVMVNPQVLFAGDGQVWTSAGVAAGIDMCLHLIRQAHGQKTASALARAMVTAPHRTGGQAQFITTPVPPRLPSDDPIARVCRTIIAQPAEPWTVADMARTALMAERTFARRFTQATGTTPLRWLLVQRLLFAQELLEDSDESIENVAARCGFGSAVSLRQHFQRHLHTSPSDYRRTFRRQVS
ncbi:GlxA family transcriptional regulator [Streptomyces sp. 3211]|uniref:GlxA family transcriptional regulator n=1 Tax=Streptomyces sp. 3211 TaxID=1964449 RepID=UPI0009A4DB5D|nr:helix-turn-helix domain-containing protein [Streptomyces sp. 3211]